MRRGERGMSLVSVMVGAIIGGIVVASTFASLAFFQMQRRQGVGSDTALQGGMAALLELQRAVKAAGSFTMASGRPMCASINIYNQGSGVLANGRPISAIAITDGGVSSDTLTLTNATSMFAGTPARVIAAMSSANSSLKLGNAIGLAVGDVAVVGAPGTTLPCTLLQISGLSASGAFVDLLHDAGVSAPWNPVDAAAVFTNAPSYPEGALVWRVGQLNWLTYRVVGNRLQATDELAGRVDVIADQVVAMKAWYGTNDGTNKSIEQWVPATGAWTAPSATQVASLRAARIGLIVRVAAPAPPANGTCNATATALVALWPSGPTFDLSSLGSDWACYTYRTSNMVAPLRNVIYGESA